VCFHEPTTFIVAHGQDDSWKKAHATNSMHSFTFGIKPKDYEHDNLLKEAYQVNRGDPPPSAKQGVKGAAPDDLLKDLHELQDTLRQKSAPPEGACFGSKCANNNGSEQSYNQLTGAMAAASRAEGAQDPSTLTLVAGAGAGAAGSLTMLLAVGIGMRLRSRLMRGARIGMRHHDKETHPHVSR
tara:strand:+ start:1752 stop:2303 length:552 start_codon:yes stop_codon:yes gene_type:complete